ncbi:MAG: cell division protein FtsL [Tahibacter sp.]
MRHVGFVAFALLLLANLASAVAVVYQRHESRNLFVELTRLANERDEMNFEYGRLQLEQSTWAEPNRIEQVARGQLGMASPLPGGIIVIRR